MSPPTRVDALVAAAVMAHHERRQPAWAGIAARLTVWAHEQPPTEHEEGEMPSQTGIPGSADDRMSVDTNEPRTAYLLVRQSEALTDLGGRL